jgi:hypothetical protein
MVDYPIGDLVAERVRAMGVRPFYKYFEHDGVTGPNIATVYSDRGMGVRPPVVFYNRSNEAAARLKPGDRSAYYKDGWHMLTRDLQAAKVLEDVLAYLRDPQAPLPSGAPEVPAATAERRAERAGGAGLRQRP